MNSRRQGLGAFQGTPLLGGGRLRKAGEREEGKHPTSSFPRGPDLLFRPEPGNLCFLPRGGRVSRPQQQYWAAVSLNEDERGCVLRGQARAGKYSHRAVGVLPRLQQAAVLMTMAPSLHEQCLVLEFTTARTGFHVQAARAQLRVCQTALSSHPCQR